jgi:hypothetical protein
MSAAAEATKETAKKTGDRIKDAASAVSEKAGDAASYVGQKADDAAGAVGNKMQSVADSIRRGGPQEGMLGSASSALANTIESAGRQLEEHGLTGFADDITNMIRRHPVPAILVGLGVGFLLARTLTK